MPLRLMTCPFLPRDPSSTSSYVFSFSEARSSVQREGHQVPGERTLPVLPTSCFQLPVCMLVSCMSVVLRYRETLCIIFTFTGGNFLRNCVVVAAAVAVSFAVPFIAHPDSLPFSPNPTKGHHA